MGQVIFMEFILINRLIKRPIILRNPNKNFLITLEIFKAVISKVHH